MKKFLCILLVFFVALSNCSVVFGAKILHNGTCGRYVVWSITEDGVLYITGVGSMQYEFSKDDRFNATPPWEQYKSDIVKIDISDNITDIGNGAFYGCTNVKEVILPKSLTHIYKNAFASCRSLQSIELSDKIHYIAESAFHNCTSLKEIKLPDSLTEISPNTFQLCLNLEKVTFNDKLESIGYAAFHKCEKLSAVSFPDSLKSIGESAFGACIGIEEITIPESVREIGEGAFADCTGLKKATLASYEDRLDRSIFWCCTNLEEVHIPHSVTHIDGTTFGGCNNLKHIYYDGTEKEWRYVASVAHIYSRAPDCIIHCLREPQDEPTKNEENEIEGEKTPSPEIETPPENLPVDDDITPPENPGEENDTSDDTDFITPQPEQPEKDDRATYGKCGNNLSWSVNENKVLTITGFGEMYDDVERHDIGWHDYRDEINGLVLSDGIESIFEYAFWKCTSLKEVTIPETVKTIGKSAFDRCENLKSVTIPDSVTNIEKGNFRRAENLTVYCNKDSAAHKYAVDNDINFVLLNSAKNPEISFTASEWAKPELTEAYKNNLIPESMLSIDLTKEITRAEFVAIAVKLYNALNLKKSVSSLNPFTDISNNEYYNDIIMAYYLGITAGTSSVTFEPDKKITREQLATMLCRVIKLQMYPDWTLAEDAKFPLDISGVKKFDDDADISEFAKPSVYYMAKKGIIKGVDTNKFAPRNINASQEKSGYASATIEQALIMSLRAYINK